MFRSLHIASTGMAAQEAELDSISNNLANSNTVGYKKSRADFQDLVYQTMRGAGTELQVAAPTTPPPPPAPAPEAGAAPAPAPAAAPAEKPLSRLEKLRLQGKGQPPK